MAQRTADAFFQHQECAAPFVDFTAAYYRVVMPALLEKLSPNISLISSCPSCESPREPFAFIFGLLDHLCRLEGLLSTLNSIRAPAPKWFRWLPHYSLIKYGPSQIYWPLNVLVGKQYERRDDSIAGRYSKCNIKQSLTEISSKQQSAHCLKHVCRSK